MPLVSILFFAIFASISLNGLVKCASAAPPQTAFELPESPSKVSTWWSSRIASPIVYVSYDTAGGHNLLSRVDWQNRTNSGSSNLKALLKWYVRGMVLRCNSLFHQHILELLNGGLAGEAFTSDTITDGLLGNYCFTHRNRLPRVAGYYYRAVTIEIHSRSSMGQIQQTLVNQNSHHRTCTRYLGQGEQNIWLDKRQKAAYRALDSSHKNG